MRRMLPPLLTLAALWIMPPAHAGDATPPDEFLGRAVGADFQLADWQEVKGYYQRLAAECPRVRLDLLGETTEGREFLMATITSEANHARLAEIQSDCARIADPRGLTPAERRRLIEDGVVALFISPAMHSTETAAPQFGMEFAWRLATLDEEPYRTARERMVVCLFPCTNPDGLDRVVEWYRQTVGTPHEGTGLTELYQTYAGHDNNRDWFMLSLAETRLVTEQLYRAWRPQVYWDVHQQGGSGERMFVPPFRDPLNPNLDPAIIAGINTLGTRAQFDMTRAGLTGVATGVSYDMWWNGGNRNVPVRHNMIGLLTEAASVNVASPVFHEPGRIRSPSGDGAYLPQNTFPAPWPGGWWRLRDIIDYEHEFGRSLLRSLSSEPSTWIENAIAAAERSIAAGQAGAPAAYLIPSFNEDRGAVRRLVDVLLRTGVEVDAATTEVLADGRSWPAGSLIIGLDQPYGRWVKDLFEIQRFPDGHDPYDVTGWSLPLLLGVDRVEVVADPDARRRRVTSLDDALRGFPDRGERLDAADSDSWRAVFQGLSAGASFQLREGPDGDFEFAPGSAADGGRGVTIAPRRIGLYAPWTSSMTEGWTRWVFDAFDVPYVRVRNEMIRAGRLGDLVDVLVLPHVRGSRIEDGRSLGSVPDAYAGGLAPEGVVAIEQFVRDGGRLIAIDDSCDFAIDLFRLPVSDTTRGAEGFSCPGSVLRAVPERSPFTAGLRDSIPLFFSRSAALRTVSGEPRCEVLLRYAPVRPLLSGHIAKPQTIAGEGAWVRAAVGDGEVHLFGFQPQYRSWSQATFPLLFRAMLIDS